jgi:hypothetical protein
MASSRDLNFDEVGFAIEHRPSAPELIFILDYVNCFLRGEMACNIPKMPRSYRVSSE